MLLRGGCVEGIEKCRFKDGPGSGLEIILKEYRVDFKKRVSIRLINGLELVKK